MKFLLLAFLIAFGLESILSTVVLKNNTVYVDEKAVDLDKLEIMDETPLVKRYMFQSGDVNITITKSKLGKGVSVSTVSKMTPEEAAKAQEMQKKLSEKISKKVEKFQNEVDTQIKAINDKINKNFKSMMNAFPIFGWGF